MESKTPITKLYELLGKCDMTPRFELVHLKSDNKLTFRYSVSFTFNGITYIAIGAAACSKKVAKQLAAKALQDKINGKSDMLNDDVLVNAENENNNQNIGEGASDEIMVGSPISYLQELCIKYRWPLPTYKTILEGALSHQSQFTVTCIILNYREVGKGGKIKIAKRIAAHKMWKRLKANPSGQQCDKGDEQSSCSNDSHINYIQILQNIAKEKYFKITYIDVKKKTNTGVYKCLVKSEMLPDAGCEGVGKTLDEAQVHAAQIALTYLKINTK